ncbi:hypothetical protein BJ322DRAFT_1044315 [Thelephora terrestris]|uniref:Uncharacterized protein n=1 Tax=Thelephora terrestris TaxID=56493 RepID=A0A9P6LAS6_9AGAM|nr:hypothetical protein BJ322DRAFT_1044315 [Thelephora terrestris]
MLRRLVFALPPLVVRAALVEKFPRLRKLCLPEPSATDMSHFLGLKEITELEILVNPKSVSDKRYDLEPIKAMAIQILQGSECHKDCACDHRCECTRTGDCYKCKPPKRFLRIKACPGACLVAPYSASNGGGTIPEEYRLEEIRVSPRRVVSRK